MDVLKFGFSYYRRNLIPAILMQLLSFLALLADLLLPLITAMFINFIILENDPGQDNTIFSFMLNGSYGKVHTMELFWNLAIVFLSLLLLKLIFVYVKNVVNQKLGLRLETDLRMVTFKKIMELDSETLSEFNTGELLTTINWDTIMYKEMFCRIIPNILDSSFVLLVSIILLATIHPLLLIIPVIMMPIFLYALRKFKNVSRMNFRDIRACNSNMALTVQENIEAVRLVRSFTNEEREKEKFTKSNENLRKSYIKQVKLQAKFEAAFSSIKQFAYIGSIAVCAILVMNGYILVGFLASCAGYILKIMDYITMINNMIFQMQQQIVSGYKMMHLMSSESKIPNGQEKLAEDQKPNLVFKDFTISCNGKDLIKNVNLEIPYGKKVGIVGGTGSGKTSLLEGLIRIRDGSKGELTLNGKNVKEYDLTNLRNQFSFVFQEVFLFSNTIKSNIAYSKEDADMETIITMAKHAQAHDFITKLDDGYDTIVGERGLGISGGQKQRVSIARALLKNSPILVLDDSTSALDTATEKQLLADIKKYDDEKTLIISAHRLSSVVDCDEILYLLDGEIVERGSFDELMELDGHFANVYKIQEAQKNSVIDYQNLKEAN